MLEVHLATAHNYITQTLLFLNKNNIEINANEISFFLEWMILKLVN